MENVAKVGVFCKITKRRIRQLLLQTYNDDDYDDIMKTCSSLLGLVTNIKHRRDRCKRVAWPTNVDKGGGIVVGGMEIRSLTFFNDSHPLPQLL